MITSEKSLEVSDLNEDDYSSTATNSNKSNYKFRQKIRKRSSDICYTLNFYEKFGFIYITQSLNKTFVAKIRKVDLDDNFQELFEKGKNNLGNYFKEGSINIPDITFWYQRYYYYSRFDEGIKMDQESNLMNVKYRLVVCYSRGIG
jgi:hypothetical protein